MEPISSSFHLHCFHRYNFHRFSNQHMHNHNHLHTGEMMKSVHAYKILHPEVFEEEERLRLEAEAGYRVSAHL